MVLRLKRWSSWNLHGSGGQADARAVGGQRYRKVSGAERAVGL